MGEFRQVAIIALTWSECRRALPPHGLYIPDLHGFEQSSRAGS